MDYCKIMQCTNEAVSSIFRFDCIERKSAPITNLSVVFQRFFRQKKNCRKTLFHVFYKLD